MAFRVWNHPLVVRVLFGSTQVLGLRNMLSVCYFEKALYELPPDELTAIAVAALADRVERNVQGGLSGRPLLSVPHLLSDEVRSPSGSLGDSRFKKLNDNINILFKMSFKK